MPAAFTRCLYALLLGALLGFPANAEPLHNDMPAPGLEGDFDGSKVPPGFTLFWSKFQAVVLAGDVTGVAQLTIFPLGAPCDRKAVQLKEFALTFHKYMKTIVMVHDIRIDSYVEMSLFNLVVSSGLYHPDFHFMSKDRVTLNRLEFRHLLGKWYWACW